MKENKEMSMHRVINFSKCDQLKVFVHEYFCCFFLCKPKSPELRKYYKLMKYGKKKLESELEVCRVIKDLRKVRLFNENQWVDHHLKQLDTKLRHQDENVINLDSSENHDEYQASELSFDNQIDSDDLQKDLDE